MRNYPRLLQEQARRQALFSTDETLVSDWGPLKPLEKLLLRSPLVGLSFLASNLYHNGYWLRTHGRRRIAAALKTEWGELFQSY